jgi:hypothetical protein
VETPKIKKKPRRKIHYKFFCPPAKGFVENYTYKGKVDELFDNEDPTLIPIEYAGIDNIYEGDILEITIPTWKKTYRGHILFERGSFGLKIHNPQGTLSILWLHQFQSYNVQYTHLGNILENPELLM